MAFPLFFLIVSEASPILEMVKVYSTSGRVGCVAGGGVGLEGCAGVATVRGARARRGGVVGGDAAAAARMFASTVSRSISSDVS